MSEGDASTEMIASFYYIPTWNLKWTKFIHIYLVYIQKRNLAEEPEYIPRTKNQYTKTEGKAKLQLKQTMKIVLRIYILL